MEQYSRNANLLIHGIKQPTSGTEQNLTGDVLNLLNTNLGLSLQEQDLTAVHRIGRTTQPAQTAPDGTPATPKPPAIAVQFSNRRIRNEVLFKVMHLKVKDSLSLNN